MTDVALALVPGGGFISSAIAADPLLSKVTAGTGLGSLLGDSGFWTRLGIGALGVGLIIVGLAIFISSSKVVRDVAGAAVTTAVTKNPVGAVAATAVKAAT